MVYKSEFFCKLTIHSIFEQKKTIHSFKFLSTIFTILNLIDKNSLVSSDIEKIDYYLDIIFTQMTEEELALLFYYGVYYKVADFKELLEEYAFFQDLDTELYVEDKELLHYDIKAYGNNDETKSQYIKIKLEQ